MHVIKGEEPTLSSQNLYHACLHQHNAIAGGTSSKVLQPIPAAAVGTFAKSFAPVHRTRFAFRSKSYSRQPESTSSFLDTSLRRRQRQRLTTESSPGSTTMVSSAPLVPIRQLPASATTSNRAHFFHGSDNINAVPPAALVDSATAVGRMS